MDTQAYLKRHGWRGDGHSLDTTDRGIRRPLLVSKKVDVLGVGLNKHAAVSDQWWMRAFDEGLKKLGSGTKSTLANVREKGVHYGGLYGRFVKGETVEGTMESEDDKASKAAETTALKRKRDGKGEGSGSGKSSRRKMNGTDMSAGEQLAKRLSSQTKVVLNEAVKRGLVPKGSKSVSVERTSSRKSPKVDEATFIHIFDQAGLKEPAAIGEGSSKSARKQAKHTREKLQRELKRAARAYFNSQLSPADRTLVKQVEEAKEMQQSSKGELKQVDRYNLAAQKTITKDVKRKERLEKKQTSGAVSAAKAARYAERAAAKGVSVEDYILRREEKYAAKKTQSSSSSENVVDFVVDTTGDPALKTQGMMVSAPVITPSSIHVVAKKTAGKGSTDEDETKVAERKRTKKSKKVK